MAAERISEAELSVMEVLWASPEPLTAAEIVLRIDDSGRDWSDSTVKTMIGRLMGKGVVAHQEKGRRYLYTAKVAREDFVRGESRRLVDRLFGGRAAPLVAHLAENEGLSADDIAELQALLKEMKP